MRPFLAALAAALIGTATLVAAQTNETLRIEHPWARATAPAARAGGAYLTVTNTGAAPDRLVAAASPVAERVELHTHLMDGGIMRMREVEGGIPVPPGATVTLEPGGLHVMLLGLKQPLAQGGRFPLTLTFEQAGAIPVDVTVEGIAARMPGAHSMDSMPHDAPHNQGMHGHGAMPGK